MKTALVASLLLALAVAAGQGVVIADNDKAEPAEERIQLLEQRLGELEAKVKSLEESSTTRILPPGSLKGSLVLPDRTRKSTPRGSWDFEFFKNHYGQVVFVQNDPVTMSGHTD
ncbi:MAG: hypothetical protein HY706_10610 [Candidatus Hydrogenedentes bacterium]|nr:hypothetical protein [Candidatus Hydrogenedentota bacterium]